jgi:HD superfamily phosphohydrolase
MRIHDNIHGYIELDPIASAIVDTPIFQRLRHIHQTGVLYLVFPTANHSRFEHSIGTYHLATQMIETIAKKQPELKVTDELITIVGIAGLCHDLGHLMFSHLFDDYFLEQLPNYEELKQMTPNITHENRSIFLLHQIVERYKVPLTKEMLRVIGDLINPKQAEYSKWKSKYMVGRWIFQIISNPLNSIDVDKFDYLTRDTVAVGFKLQFDYSRIISDAKVIDNKICYSSQCSEDIYHMFFIRYRLHRQIYNHKAVKAIEILIVRILFEMEKEMNISSYIVDTDKMLDLVDSMVMMKKTPIMNDIYMRKLPKLVYQKISLSPIEFDENKFKTVFNPSTYNIIRFKVGYVGGKTNPLNRIYFYNSKTGNIITSEDHNKARNFSLLINQKHQEYFFRIYCLDPSVKTAMMEYFEEDKESSEENHNATHDAIHDMTEIIP